MDYFKPCLYDVNMCYHTVEDMRHYKV